MNWLRTIMWVLVLWSNSAWGATLTWSANSEPDLAGYRVYRCSQLPCTRTSGSPSLLAALEGITNFDIGTPTQVQYYFITAYDTAANESDASNLATFIPAGSPLPLPLDVPPTPSGLRITPVS